MKIPLICELRKLIPRNPSTVTGRLMLVGTTFGLMCVFESSLVSILAYLSMLLAVAFSFGLLYRPRLRGTWADVPLAQHGAEFTLSLVVQNLRHFDAFDLQIDLAEPPNGFQLVQPITPIAVLASHASRVVEIRALATRRGRHHLPDLQVSSLFPLGLFRFLQYVRSSETLDIAPAIVECSSPISGLINVCEQSEHGSRRASQAILEYIGSREYQTGMPVRRWDFASWARLGKPTVREFSEGNEAMVVLIVDTRVARPASYDRELEVLLSLAAGVVDSTSQMGLPLAMILSEDWISEQEPLLYMELSPEDRDTHLRRLACTAGTKLEVLCGKMIAGAIDAIPDNATILAVLGSAAKRIVMHDVDPYLRSRIHIVNQLSVVDSQIVATSGTRGH